MSPRRVAVACCLLLVGCERKPLTGPPEIKLGRDQCIQCGMIISEERFAAGLLVQEAKERRFVLFDDIGDMLDYERRTPGVAVCERWVHDHDATRGWIPAEKAHYVVADGLATPMGSGIVAFLDTPRAEASSKGKAGRVFTWEELQSVGWKSRK